MRPLHTLWVLKVRVSERLVCSFLAQPCFDKFILWQGTLEHPKLLL